MELGNVENSTNMFQNYAFGIYKLYSSEPEVPSYKRFGKTIESDFSIKCNSLSNLYLINTIDKLKDDTISNDEWLSTIRKYAEFLVTAEKCFMYNNSDDSYIYSVINKTNDITTLYIIPEKIDCKITIEFQESALNIPGSKAKSPLDFMRDEEPIQNTALFVSITVERTSGNNNISNFSFLYGSEVPCNELTDIILYHNIKHIVSNTIISNFNEIIELIKEEGRYK